MNDLRCRCGHVDVRHVDRVGQCRVGWTFQRLQGKHRCSCEQFAPVAMTPAGKTPVFLSIAELVAAQRLVEREMETHVETHADTETMATMRGLADALNVRPA